jgi:Peptidase A4 family
MRYFPVSLIIAFVVQTALAELTYTIEATSHGRPVDPASLVLTPHTTVDRRMKLTSHEELSIPPPRTGKVRRASSTLVSRNWCGMANHAPTTNKITEIHGYYQVPNVTVRSGQTGDFPQSLSVWVGIDGESGCAALLQAGTDCNVCVGIEVNCHSFPSWPGRRIQFICGMLTFDLVR